MDEHYIEQHDLVSKYRLGKLSLEEAAEFEIFILDRPDLLEKLEADMLLTKGFEQLEIADRHKPQSAAAMMSSSRLMALAASVAVLGMLGSLAYNSMLREELQDYRQGMANVPLIAVDVTRSSPEPANTDDFERAAGLLKIDANAKFAVINIMMALDAKPEYQIKILDFPARSLVVSYAGVEPIGSGDLIVSVPPHLLVTGNYLIEISSPGVEPIVAPLRVEKTD